MESIGTVSITGLTGLRSSIMRRQRVTIFCLYISINTQLVVDRRAKGSQSNIHVRRKWPPLSAA